MDLLTYVLPLALVVIMGLLFYLLIPIVWKEIRGMKDKEISEALSKNVEDGTVEIVGMDENGELTFRLTEAGVQRARELIASRGLDPDKVKDLTFAEFKTAMGMDDA